MPGEINNTIHLIIGDNTDLSHARLITAVDSILTAYSHMPHARIHLMIPGFDTRDWDLYETPETTHYVAKLRKALRCFGVDWENLNFTKESAELLEMSHDNDW